MEEPGRLQSHLALFRACAGWTAQDFADRLEVSRQSVSAWENYGTSGGLKGVRLTAIQYLAIRKLLDDEIAQDLSDDTARRKQHILGTMLEVLVDHPERYTQEDREAAVSEAQLMAPSIMKQPEQRKSVSKVWPALLVGCGVLLSAAFLALIGHNPDGTGDAPQH